MSKMLRSSPLPPVFSTINSSNKIDYRSCKELIQYYLEDENSKAMPELIQKAINNFDDYNLAVSSLGNAISKIILRLLLI